MFEKLFDDPRHFQMMALSSLLMAILTIYDFAPSLKIIGSIFISAITTQFIFYRLFSIHSMDYRSPIITSLSLCLLFKTSLWWLYPCAAIIAIASKFLLRYRDKHLFNPANAAIVLLLLMAPNYVWVSPGQWGNEIWLGFALICLAGLVLGKARRMDTALFFLGAWTLLLLARAIWLGDPLEIPMHHLQSGALLIFAFFMISDPMTTPNSCIGRLCFAIAVAMVTYILAYGLQIREAIFYALFIICFITPFLDRVFQSHRYEWRKIS